MLVEIIEKVDVDIAPPSAERIVRCAECVHYQEGVMTRWGNCQFFEAITLKQGYCYEGRKENENEQ